MSSRLELTQALTRAQAYQRLGRPVPRATRFAGIKKIEARLTWPLFFRQIKFNESVVEVLKGVMAGLENRATTTESRVRYQQHHEGMAALRRDMVVLQQQLVEAEKQIAKLQSAHRGQQTQVELFLDEVRRSLPEPPERERLAALPTAWETLANAFADRLRGSYEEVQDRIRIYLDDLPPGVDDDHPVVDLACGRGEWLDLLRSKGIPAYGVDPSPSVVRRVADRGLDIRLGHPAEHLRDVPERSLSVVTGFHLAEHVPTDALVELLDLALRALRPGGRLILETPNPTNVVVGAATFWLDPSHLRPIPPALLGFLVEMRGFADVETRFLTREVGPLHPPAAMAGEPGIGALFDVVNRSLGAPEDYAVLAVRL